MSDKLFQSHTYSQRLPAPFNTPGVNKSRSDVKSMHRPAQSTVTLHAPILKAALGFINSLLGDGKVSVGRQGKLILVERETSKGDFEVVVYDTTNGSFKAAVFSDINGAPDAYSLGKSKKDATTLFVALIYDSFFCSPENELRENLARIKGHVDGSSPLDEDELSKCGAILCDNIYTRIKSADSLGSSGIKTQIPNTSNIQMLNRLAIDQATYAPEEVFSGEFRVFNAANAKKLGYKPVANTDLPSKYAFSEREFSPEEQALIPDVPDWYIVPKEVVRISQHAQATTEGSQPMRNFMLRGPAGVGKTEGARAIASALNLPYLSLTCSANTEIFDVLGQILPDVEGMEASENSNVINFPNMANLPKLPTLEDIQMDTATAYEMLTGIYNENIGTDEVYAKLLEVVASTAAMQANSGNVSDSTGQKFRYVETPLVKAMKNGYLIELQEPSVIANPGVLVGLNSLLDNGKQMTLPTGETIKRHPDTVVVVTTNHDYSGCRDMNQSVISRMNLVMDIDEPTNKELATRVTAITGCADEEALALMTSVVKDIQQQCRETLINDGCCGMRELISWAQSYMVTKDLAESVQYTVLSSVSANPDSREHIQNTCINPKVAPQAQAA
jgi:MoxR-like ATPase